MKNILRNKDVIMSLLFSLIGIIATIFVAMYQISMFSESMEQEVIAQLGSTTLLIPIAAVQGALLTFVFTFLGLKLARKVNLRLNFKWDKKSLLAALLIGFIIGLIITASDQFVFAGDLPPESAEYVFSPLYLISGVLYGRIIEEILLRLFVMSLLVLIGWKMFVRSRDHLNIPDWIYISAIILSSVLFAAGHAPATAQLFGLSAPILIRMFFLNGIGGMGFGYLYWKQGLAYSMVAHAAAHIFMQTLFLPIVQHL